MLTIPGPSSDAHHPWSLFGCSPSLVAGPGLVGTSIFYALPVQIYDFEHPVSQLNCTTTLQQNVEQEDQALKVFVALAQAHDAWSNSWSTSRP
jgi:hypothetical protein